MHGIGVSGGVVWLCDPWRDYLNRFSPAPSSHCGRCTLIWCAGTWDLSMQPWVEHTKVIAILLLTYLHVLEQDCFHLVSRRMTNLFRVTVACTPSSPSTEATKGEMCRCCWRYASRYIRFFHLSASCSHSLDTLSCVTGRWCSRPACREHCLYLAAIVHRSAGRPSVP